MISFKNVDFSYTDKEPLFENFSLSLESGKIVGLLGPNGAGKTTVLKLMSGLLSAKSGEIEVLGHTPFLKKKEFFQRLLYIPEEIQFPSVTLEKYAALLKPFYPLFDSEVFQEICDAFKIKSKVNIGSLSFGQRRKALLSLAIATNCNIIIFDEPTNGLDIESQHQIRKILAKNIRPDKNFIISTHHVREFDALVNHLIIMEKSNLLFCGSLETVESRFLKVTDKENHKVFYEDSSSAPSQFLVSNESGAATKMDLEFFYLAVLANHYSINENCK